MLFRPKEKVILAIAFFLLLLDRLAKVAAIKIWQFEEVSLFPWLKLTLAINRNIAFSLPLSGFFLNLGLVFLVLFLGYYWLFFIKKRQSQEALLLTIILINAINNLVDRFIYGGVIDYFSLQHFSVFNLADAVICITAILAGIYFSKQQLTQQTKQRKTWQVKETQKRPTS